MINLLDALNMTSAIEDSILIAIASSWIPACIFFSMTFAACLMLYFNRKLPPGPWGIPYFGYLPFINLKETHLWYVKKAVMYGDIFSVKLGNNLVVCIGSAQLLKKLFKRHDSTGRAPTPLNQLLGGMGIILSEGLLWKNQRKFLHDAFRNLGIRMWPNQRFEKFVHMEVKDLLQTLGRLNGVAVDPTLIIGRNMHNIICQLIMSFRFEENDENFKMFNEKVTRGMQLYGSVQWAEHLKYYMLLPGTKAVFLEIQENLNEISKFHADHLRRRKEYRRNVSEAYEPADLLDNYLEKIENEDVETLFPDIDPDRQIVQVMNDLFSAGMETSRNSLLWFLVMMMRERAVAEKVRQELNRTVQVGQVVTLEHRLLMPYIEAVIFETLRFVSIVPLGTTHVNTTTWHEGDYIIPAGTHIIPLINKMNVDPETYPEPHTFKPERFLREGQFYKPENFMPFGVGQRACLGTQLARLELFLFFANLMNNFNVSVPEGQEVPGLEGVVGTTIAPLPYEVCFDQLEN